MANLRELSREKLSDKNKNNFCPYCFGAALKMEDWKSWTKDNSLYAVRVVEQAERQDGTVFNYYSTLYYCPKCQRTMTLEQYLDKTVTKADGTRWSEPRKRNETNREA